MKKCIRLRGSEWLCFVAGCLAPSVAAALDYSCRPVQALTSWSRAVPLHTTFGL